MFLFFFSLFFFVYSCIINFIITILLSPFSTSSLSLLLLYYNPLLSLKLLFLPLLTHSFPCPHIPSTLPQPFTTLPFPPKHSPAAEKPTLPTAHNPRLLQSLTQTPPLQQQKYIQTYTRATKPSNPITLNLHTHSFSHPPFF
jgi:hypothetical protein